MPPLRGSKSGTPVIPALIALGYAYVAAPRLRDRQKSTSGLGNPAARRLRSDREPFMPLRMDDRMSVTTKERHVKTVEEALNRELAVTFTSAGASDRWLRTPNPILNGDQPIECLKRREYDRVNAALEAFNGGVYV
jgi:hypothetical protein